MLEEVGSYLLSGCLMVFLLQNLLEHDSQFFDLVRIQLLYLRLVLEVLGRSQSQFVSKYAWIVLGSKLKSNYSSEIICITFEDTIATYFRVTGFVEGGMDSVENAEKTRSRTSCTEPLSFYGGNLNI